MTYRTGRFFLLLLLASFLAVTGCDSDDPEEEPFGLVITMTNTAASNDVMVFRRAADGSLTALGTFATDQQGSGPPPELPVDPLESQDALILSADNEFLFVVNAGSNSITSFAVEEDGTLTRVATVPSGGVFPVSLGLRGDVLYVLNGGRPGAPGNITGFRVAADGGMAPIAGSTQPLSGVPTPDPLNGFVAPSVMAFSPNGRFLVVTEKVTNLINVYVVDGAGVAGPPNTQPSAGPTPFGAEFDANGVLIVSNANAPTPTTPVFDESSVSSYTIGADGTLTVVSAEARTEETAACWIQVTDDNRFVYTTNTLSDSITGFLLGAGGVLTSLDPADGQTATLAPMAFPLDMAVAEEFLYVLSAGVGEINGFRVGADGSLTAVPGATVGGLPSLTIEGLDAF